MFALQQQARQRHAAAGGSNNGFGFDDPSFSSGDLDALQKQYRDQLNSLDYDDMLLNRNRPSTSQETLDDGNGLHSTISPPLRNKFTSTPPARSNSTPPGRNMYNDLERQADLLMNPFANFNLNDTVSFSFYIMA